MAKVHLIFFSSPGAGHIVSTAEMAKRLLLHHPNSTESHFSATTPSFLWALRVQRTSDEENVSLNKILPAGFMERTKDRGFVWPSWVPQLQILAHRAVGGFVTHCGWNSCLESLWCGVPMLGWPLYAEQPGHSFLMAKDMGVALELEVDRKRCNFVASKDLENGVKRLMGDCEEGKRVRSRVKEFKFVCRKTMEVGEPSFEYMEKLVKELSSISES